MEVPRSRKSPKGPINELHKAAEAGPTDSALALLSRGVIDIDEGEPDGTTPLMRAAGFGRSRVFRLLLDKGASVAITNDAGYTALHLSAQEGQLAITKLLRQAGAYLEAMSPSTGATPLECAAYRGHSEVMSLLIDAGANPNSRG